MKFEVTCEILRGVPDLRYAQYCPLARAAELLGERWTLLAIRELLMGPMRFTDLRDRLPGVSPSVLTERLAKLEARDVVRRRTLPPPAAATVYELTETGRALETAIGALATWGMRLLARPLPGDDVHPRAVRIVLSLAAARHASPPLRALVRMPDRAGEVRCVVAGGPHGTRVEDAAPDEPADVTLSADAVHVAALAHGGLDPVRAAREGTISVEGDAARLVDFPRLFDPSLNANPPRKESP